MISQARSCFNGFHSTTSTLLLDFSLSTTCFNARVTGGCGFTTPSSQRTATFNFFPAGKKFSFFQGNGRRDGSFSHGFASMMVFVNILQPSRLVESGPIVGTICSAPPIVASNPFMGRRPLVGFKPYTPISRSETPSQSFGEKFLPLFAAGDRIDPPISVPIPKQEPLNPTSAPSPPEDPPGVRVVLNGFVVILFPSALHSNPLPSSYSPINIATGIQMHQTLRLCSPRIKHCSSIPEYLQNMRILFSNTSHPSYEPSIVI
jgi:hypothetical protein